MTYGVDLVEKFTYLMIKRVNFGILAIGSATVVGSACNAYVPTYLPKHLVESQLHVQFTPHALLTRDLYHYSSTNHRY